MTFPDIQNIRTGFTCDARSIQIIKANPTIHIDSDFNKKYFIHKFKVCTLIPWYTYTCHHRQFQLLPTFTWSHNCPWFNLQNKIILKNAAKSVFCANETKKKDYLRLELEETRIESHIKTGSPHTHIQITHLSASRRYTKAIVCACCETWIVVRIKIRRINKSLLYVALRWK